MNRFDTLYRALNSLCPTNFTCYFGTLEQNSTYSYSITNGGGSPEARNVTSGHYGVRKALITFNINGDMTTEAINDVQIFCDQVIDAYEQLSNHFYVDPETDDAVEIVSISVEGDAEHTGFNAFKYCVFSMNFIVKYTGG